MAHGSAGYRQKRSRGHGPGSSDENCGDLSSLPDPLFHHILSFLPTKQVVQTSLVSRRWRDVWTHVPVLDLDERSFSQIEDVRGFIDRVLGCHRVACLQKFFLSFSDFDNTGVVVPHAIKLILRWVRYAAEHFIEEIDLSIRLYWEESIKLPGSLFSCEYLTVMKLNLNDAYLLLPEYMHLPSLKDLQLIRVEIQGLGSSFQQLLSGCPKLEKLSIIDCTLENFEILDFSGCLHLEILRMKHFRWIDGNAIHISSPKLRTLIMKSSVDPICEMRISAPNLRHFKYDSMPWTLSIERLSSLVNAHIGRPLGLHIFSSDDDDGCPLKERVNNMVLVLFRGLENARRLFIAGDSLKDFLKVTKRFKALSWVQVPHELAS